MGEDTEHEASRGEYALVGSIGTLLYTTLSVFVLYVLKTSRSKNSKTIAFFKLMVAMCICEVPRFFSIAVTRKYDWRSLYILHIISGGLFFASFSIVCLQWSSLLKLDAYVKVLFSRKVLIVINVLFAVFDFFAIVMCARADSLVDFFESYFFYIYIFGDALKNIFFSIFLAFHGVRLIMKFYRYSTIELNSRDVNSSHSKGNSVFSTALSRLTVTLVVASCCFVIRLMMLIVKSVALSSNDTVTSKEFPLFGLLWFCFSDFIPRVLPSTTFVLLMRSRRREVKREMESSLSGGYNDEEYGEDSDEYDDDGEDSYESWSQEEGQDELTVALFAPSGGDDGGVSAAEVAEERQRQLTSEEFSLTSFSAMGDGSL